MQQGRSTLDPDYCSRHHVLIERRGDVVRVPWHLYGRNIGTRGRATNKDGTERDECNSIFLFHTIVIISLLIKISMRYRLTRSNSASFDNHH